MEKATKEQVKAYMTSKKFIVSVSLCALMLAIGIGGALRVNHILKKQLENITRENTTESTSAQSVTEKVEEKVTGIPDERTEPRTTEKIDIVKDEGFIFPVGKSISKDYSGGTAVKSKTMNDWRVHNAVDFACKKSEEVKAIQSGAVLAVYDSSLWGVILEIDHGNGIVARYCGLERGSVPDASEAVEQGDIIGRVGSVPVEAADGVHLHLEITKNGKTVDPLSLFGEDVSD